MTHAMLRRLTSWRCIIILLLLVLPENFLWPHYSGAWFIIIKAPEPRFLRHCLLIFTQSPHWNRTGADPELVSRGAEPMSSAPPVPSPPPFLPSCPFPSLPSCPFPSLLFPSLSSLPSLPLKRGGRGSSPGKFWNSRLLRVLAHSGMQKGVCKCVFLGHAMKKKFGPSLGGAITPSPVDPPLLINRIIGFLRHLKRFGYVTLWYHSIVLLFLILSASCIYSDILYIICCFISESTIIWSTLKQKRHAKSTASEDLASTNQSAYLKPKITFT